MVTKSLGASGLTLLNTVAEDGEQGALRRATVFATDKGLENLRKKIQDFETRNHPTSGRPANADLVQSIGAIVEAGLKALWRSPAERFPARDEVSAWEIWLEKSSAEAFITASRALGVMVGADRL